MGEGGVSGCDKGRGMAAAAGGRRGGGGGGGRKERQTRRLRTQRQTCGKRERERRVVQRRGKTSGSGGKGKREVQLAAERVTSIAAKVPIWLFVFDTHAAEADPLHTLGHFSLPQISDNPRSLFLFSVASFVANWYWQSGKRKRKERKRMAKDKFVNQASTGNSEGMSGEDEEASGETSMWIILLLSVLIDAAGCASYVLPFFGELSDLIEAPLAAIAMQKLYGSTVMTTALLVEELLPFTDVIPTATIAWFLKFTALGKLIPILSLGRGRKSSDSKKEKTN